MRMIDADALIEKCGGWYVEEGTESGFIGTLKNLLATEPTIQPVETDINVGDKICRQAAIDALMERFKRVPTNAIIAKDVIEKLPSVQSEKQHGRIFQEIVVEYPSYHTYPEYKGKPYFSIKYTESGQEFIGYGTYKPEVLSKYLKEYFMPSAQSEEAIPISWIEAIIKKFMMTGDAFSGLTASIIRVMLNEWKREQEGDTT